MHKCVSEFEFYHALEQHQGELIVMFTHDKCGSCRTWERLLGEFKSRLGIDVWLIDAVENMALTREYEVFHLPSLFLFVNGHFHCPLQSEARLPLLELAFKQALTEPAQEAP